MFTNPFNEAVTVLDGRVTVHDESAIASPAMDKLVYTAVFGEPDDREDARWLIWEIGQAVGVQPASIHDLYRARGQGKVSGFTVPAMNIRGMVYDTARSLFRTAVRLKVGALIQEIARSEIAYTDQRPAEYVAVMLAAALREGFRGPIFMSRCFLLDSTKTRSRKSWRQPPTATSWCRGIWSTPAGPFWRIPSMC